MGEANENDRNTSQILSLTEILEFALNWKSMIKINGAITYQQVEYQLYKHFGLQDV